MVIRKLHQKKDRKGLTQTAGRVLAAFLAFVFVLSMIPTQALADENEGVQADVIPGENRKADDGNSITDDDNVMADDGIKQESLQVSDPALEEQKTAETESAAEASMENMEKEEKKLTEAALETFGSEMPLAASGQEESITVLERADQKLISDWNDNSGAKATDPENLVDRPSSDSYKSLLSIFYKKGGQNTYTKLTAENCSEIGLSEMPSLSADTSHANRMVFTAAQLPVKIRENDTEDNISYIIAGTGANGEPSVINISGYLGDTTLPEVRDNQIVLSYTVMIDWQASVQWHDNSDLHGNRPDDIRSCPGDLFTLYRMLSNYPKTTAVEVDDPDIAVTENGDIWNLQLTGMPAYDENGNAYLYFLEPTEQPVGKHPDSVGHYALTVINTGNYSSDTTDLNPEGQLIAVLEKTDSFSVRKEWKDLGMHTRPNTKLYLYRISEDSNGDISAEAVKQASPVQGHDYQDIGTDQDTLTVTFNNLPMYDNAGKRYVYFALENGLTGDYQMETDNSGSSEPDAVKAVFAQIKSGNTEKYALNNSTLTNIRKAEHSADVTKKFSALSMQSMQNEQVRAKLQSSRWTGSEWGTWEDVGADGIVSYDHERTDILVTADKVEIMVSGFCEEDMDITVTGPVVRSYTENGTALRYRWVETELQVNGDTHAVEIQSDGTYKKINMGRIGPDDTTAYFEPANNPDDLSVITNTLTGKTKMTVTKQWIDTDGSNISGDSEKMQGVNINFTLRADGQEKETQNLTVADYNATDRCWEYTWDLPRYDADGREIAYSVKEGAIVDPQSRAWAQHYTYERKTVQDQNDVITESTVKYVNSLHGTDGLIFDVEKQWLDGGDLLSRQPVSVGIFHINSPETPVAVGTLNSGNGWRERINVILGEQDDHDITHYYVKETKIGEVAPEYSSTLSFMSWGDTVYSYDKATGTAGRSGQQAVPGLEYDYHIYIQRQQSGNTAEYLITNQRYAQADYELEKEWIGDISHPDAVFTLTYAEGTATKQFDLSGKVSLIGTEGAWEIISAGDAGKKGMLAVIAPANSQTSLSTSTKIRINSIPKYDLDGNPISYEFKEDCMRKGATFYPFDNVDGDYYTQSLNLTDVSYAGRDEHHTGDLYKFKGTNVRRETFSLTANKVWRDSGTAAAGATARPDVSFTLYRVSTDGKDDLLQAAQNKNTGEMISLLLNKYAGDKVRLDADHFWNTKHNDWFWSCELGSVSRYDDHGHPYIYYLVENYQAGTQGNYHKYYCNLPESTTGCKPQSGDQASTAEVLSIENSSLTNGAVQDILILADGVNKGTDGCGDYYSRTTVNRQEEVFSLSGRKIWKLPSGWILPAEERPELTVRMYSSLRTIEGLTGPDGPIEMPYHLDEIDYLVANGTVTPVGTDGSPQTLSSGAVVFRYENLPRYDEYGRKVFYWLTETHVQNYNPEDVTIDDADYYIVNTYGEEPPYVKITVEKEWIGYNSTAPASPAEFILYAQQTKDGVNALEGSSPVQMAKLAMLPVKQTDGTYKNSITFTEYQSEKISLPYYGPNNQKLKYWVTESAVPGYTSVIPTDGTGPDHPVTLTEVTGETVRMFTGAVTGFTNTYSPDSVSISRQKIWKDSDQTNADITGYRPTEIGLELWRKWDKRTIDGVEAPGGDEYVKNASLNANNGWSFSETGLLKYAPNGSEYKYYLKEKTTDTSSWVKAYVQSNDEQGNCVNTLATVSLTLKKQWKYKAGTADPAVMTQEVLDRIRKMGSDVLPVSVALILQRSTDETNWEYVPAKTDAAAGTFVTIGSSNYIGYEKSLSSLDSSGVQFSKKLALPKYKSDGTAYKYRVIERLTWTGGTVTYSIDSSIVPSDYAYRSPEVSISPASADEKTTFTATNTVPVISVRYIKNWDDFGNRDDTRPQSVALQVVRGTQTDSVSINSIYPAKGNEWESGLMYYPVTKGTDIVSWLNSTYTVNETIPDKYVRTQETGYNIYSETTESGAAVYVYKLQNRLNENRVLTEVKASKAFLDDGKASRPARVEFTLWFKEVNGSTDYTEVTEENRDRINLAAGVSPMQVVSIGEDGTGSVSWGNLYEYWDRDETHQGIPEKIVYKVTEKMFDARGNDITDSSDYTIEVTPASGVNHTADIKVTNTYKNARITVPVVKIWEDDGDRERKRPNEITVELYADDTATGKKVTLSKAENWQAKAFSGLPRFSGGHEVLYSLREDPVEGYSIRDTEDGIVNTHEIETVSVTVSKIWDDGNDYDWYRASYGITLYANGEKYGEEVLLSKNTLEYTFKSLPKYENGERVIYTVSETTVPSKYKETVTELTEKETEDTFVFSIENYHKPGERTPVPTATPRPHDDSYDWDEPLPQSGANWAVVVLVMLGGVLLMLLGLLIGGKKNGKSR